MRHRDLQLIHKPNNWTFADEAARLALSDALPEDIGKTAFQESDDTFWRLKSDSPLEWTAVTTGGPQGEPGEQGEQGIQGEPGAAGPGVPTGGTTNQVLAKASNANFDTQWVTGGGGGGGINWVSPPENEDSPGTEQDMAYDDSALYLHNGTQWLKFSGIFHFGVVSFTFVSNGDTNGVLYFVGQNYNSAGTWTNPHTAGRVVVVRSSSDGGTATDLVDRAPNNSFSSDVANSFVSVDLGAGRSLILTDYTLRNRSFADRAVRNFRIQGSNNAASNSIPDLNAATWTDIDVRTSDTTMAAASNQFAHYVVSGTPAAYRWIRLLQTGVNSSGDNYLTIAEIELYGDFAF